jgi:hypothetical protein
LLVVVAVEVINIIVVEVVLGVLELAQVLVYLLVHIQLLLALVVRQQATVNKAGMEIIHLH